VVELPWEQALTAFWNGAFGPSFVAGTLVRATPLLFLGLSVALSFRSGLLNIGADGQFLVGAAAATTVALAGGSLPHMAVVLAMILAGAVAGGAWAGIAAIFKQRFGVLEVISTLLLNAVAMYVVAWLVRGPLQEPTGVYPQTATIPESARWPLVLPEYRLHLEFVIALFGAGFLWWFLTFTAAGFRIRAVGASVRAAANAGGINVDRTITGVFLASGALAGIAGAAEVGGITWALYEGISPAYGYTAIAVALLAGLDARLVVPSAVFFGALQAGGAAMQRDAGIPSVVVTVIIAVIVLGVLAARRGQNVVVAVSRRAGAGAP
jgi:simple sugar transport system permease protein